MSCRALLEAVAAALHEPVVVVDDRMCVVVAGGTGPCGGAGAHQAGGRFEDSARCADPRCAAVLRETLHTGRPSTLERVECRPEGGEVRVVALAAAPLRGEGGAVAGAVLVVRDQARLAALERQLAACREQSVDPGETLALVPHDPTPAARAPAARGRRLEDLPVRERIQRALERAGGNRTEAAKLLGWSRRTLYRKLAEHGIAGGETAGAG